MRRILFVIALLALAGCDSTGDVHGGGNDNGGYGRVKLSVPF